VKTPTELTKLFNPKSIAVIGATETPRKVGRIVFEQLKGSGRKLYPVHHKELQILQEKAYQSVGDLPDAIDLAIITIAAEKAVIAAEECAQKGIPFIIIIAGGFAESGPDGRSLEERLKQIPLRYSSRILGPNSLGIFLPLEKIDTIFVEHGDKALAAGGGVACIVQSGSVGVEGLGYASNTGFGMRAFVGLGNKCDLNETDFLTYFARDPHTNCLAFYLENFEQGRQFLNLAKPIALQKPIIVLKAGSTASGTQAVASHTGKLAGSDNVVTGAFRQFGIQRVYDDEELCDASKILSALPPTRGNRVAVLTGAGGYGVMCADYIERHDARAQLQMAVLSEETKRRIKKATFEFSACHNPVDITASATDEMHAGSLAALIDDPAVDIIISISFFATPGISSRLQDLIVEQARRTFKPIIIFTEYGPFTDAHLKRFYGAGVVGYPSLSRTVRATRTLVERANILKQLRDIG
jgi:acetate---CoA ligase (ADP-forming)